MHSRAYAYAGREVMVTSGAPYRKYDISILVKIGIVFITQSNRENRFL